MRGHSLVPRVIVLRNFIRVESGLDGPVAGYGFCFEGWSMGMYESSVERTGDRPRISCCLLV